MTGRGNRHSQRSQRGRQGGRGAEDAGGRNERGRKVCYNFQNTGRCHRGSTCTYVHDDAKHTNGHPKAQASRVHESAEQEQARANYNSWKRFLNPTYSTTDIHNMKRIWKGALAILQEDDRDWKQQLPRDLDDSTTKCNGRAHIMAILEKRVSVDEHMIFAEITNNFLRVITHPTLLDCLAVDTYVGGIYNFLSGVNGERAITFFQRICDTIVAVRSSHPDLFDETIQEELLIGLSTAFFEVVRRDQRARLHEAIEALLNSIETVCETASLQAQSVTSIMVDKILRDIRAMIARSKGLLTEEDLQSEQATGATTFKYPRDVVIPNNRHDNDKVNITDIIIFPTRDEIMSDAKECLPSIDPDQPHFLAHSVERHIDTNFRLLRHDVFGDLKRALAGLMHAATVDPTRLDNPNINLGDMRMYSYPNAYINYVSFDRRRGLEAQITFLQPPSIRKRAARERSVWWEDSRRLEEGSLLSLIWSQGTTVEHLFLTVTQKSTDIADKHGLSSRDTIATITTRLMTQDSKTLQSLFCSSSRRVQGVLLEFPNVIPATFVPVLNSLQNMQQSCRLPFRKWILPGPHTSPRGHLKYHNIPPPLYARRSGFTFPLKSILKNGCDDMSIDPTASGERENVIEEIAKKTELDRGQCKALVAALTREFALIQGPPGTGKSFLGLQIMKILLDIKIKAGLGPILIVCYTNHALDQFLEHLLGIGVRKVLRVGGQSKSELLRGCNLRDVARTEGKTKSEAYQSALAYQALGDHETHATQTLRRLHLASKEADWHHLRNHIQEKYPRIYAQFERTNIDGFTFVGRHPFDIWRPSSFTSTNGAQITTAELKQLLDKAEADVQSLNDAERCALLNLWVDEIRFDEVIQLETTVNDAADTHTKLSNIHDEADRRVLEGADVIGVTTSGLAKRISVLQHVRCKVVICEEAGEVMEPHMLSALLPTVEHCIQIGDHEQLRPSINNFKELSLESKEGVFHKLDRSQFERLSVGEQGRPLMPVAQLEVQRRMRPNISMLIRETIYPRIVDHQSTRHFPDVVGLRKNLYWLDHRNLENQKDHDVHHSKSKSNAWEVGLVHALVRHVVRQGVYKSNEIAVLTPYTGQLQKLRTVMRNDFEIVLSDRDQDALEKDGFEVRDMSKEAVEQQTHRRNPLEMKKLSELLRIATVDNFQGEEAKIVIVSLVRSNDKGKVGFLRTTNRINVLLSRAQHGMYLIGNTETYTSVPMWDKVIDMLRASDSVGQSIGLCCPRHTEKIIEVQEPDDFVHFSPEGGCQEACNERLADCGHQCQARCHSTAMHNVFKCEKPCQRRHQPCDHPCQKATCGEDCGKCMIKVSNILLPCGHIKNDVACFRTLDVPSIHCDIKVQKQVPGCQHDVTITCSQDVNNEGFKCPAPCNENLKCGHRCPGSCSQCNKHEDHGQPVVKHLDCIVVCGRKSGICQHSCPRRCHDGTDCGLCNNPCEVRCKHSRCMLKCHEPCAPCVEKCVWSCEHQGVCTMPCSAPCNRLPCDERCTKLLPCGHQCPSVCGEECPYDCCQTCGMRQEEIPDMIMGTSYSDIELDESPIVVLGCGHFFTIETLDGMIDLKSVYKVDTKTGQYIALIENSRLAASIPQCPNCRCPIRQFVTQRYNRLINRAVIDEMSKRFIVSGQQELHVLEDQLKKTESELEKTRMLVVPSINVTSDDLKAQERFVKNVNDTLSRRYKKVILHVNKVKSLQRRMADQHQPAYKLQQASYHAATRNTSLDNAFSKLNLDIPTTSSESDRDQRMIIGSRLLELKFRCLILEDKYTVVRLSRTKASIKANDMSFQGGSPTDLTPAFLHDCTKLIDDCTISNLPKIAVEAVLHYARIAQLFASSGSPTQTLRQKTTAYRETAQALLDKAAKLCEQPFQGADELAQAVEHSSRLLGKEWYEAVSKEEIDAIKKAMLGGRGGIATHSGHWYNCVNGHPFCIGECGMPMELARCPECGASVGGQSHTAVAGVSRATDMET